MTSYADFEIDAILPHPGKPDFEQLLAVLRREEPERPTLFEFFLNDNLNQQLSGVEITEDMDWLDYQVVRMKAFQRAGYDYVTVEAPGLRFEAGDVHREKSISQNEGAVIRDRKSFEAYPWPDPEQVRYDWIDALGEHLPEGMKLIVNGPGGVLENAISLVGYENLCLLIMDDPALSLEIFAQVGSRLRRYYELAAAHDCVGACISNDDWGFKTQTLFSPRGMRKYVFPWHKQIAEAIHAGGKPAILHSCGNFSRIIDDVIEDMRYDGRHSYEDTIMPVEDAYDTYYQRIAILGGIDVDFICRSTSEAVYERSRAMLTRSFGKGSFALGTGNSVPTYVPQEGYFAMICAALDMR
ncbi:MAG: hypothetical protein JW750_00860 [Anaerolineaceae bacterium]|nr:hypothetical protein [Anaerolineaceae bacterium]